LEDEMNTGVLIPLLALFVVACGGGGANPSIALNAGATPSPAGAPAGTTVGQPAGSSLDACSLLHDADILVATLRDVDTMTAGPVMGVFSNGCTWDLELAENDTVPVTIELGVVSPGGSAYYDRYLAISDNTPVSGIGDKASQSEAGGINAVTGDTLVSVFVVAFGEDEDAFTNELARAAMLRAEAAR
jgi:hypothetical protein